MDKNAAQPSKTRWRKETKPRKFLQGGVSDMLAQGPDSSGQGQMVNPDGSQSTSHGLDLNMVTVPELNVDFAHVNDSSMYKADLGCGGSDGPSEKLPAVKVARKRPSSTEANDCDGASAYKGGPGNLGQKFEYNVKVIRRLECEKHITPEFRLELLTWFSLRSSERDRRVVNAFIQTLEDDPSSLAGQLVDLFAEIKDSNKKPRTGI